MAAHVLLGLLLIVSGATAAGDDGARELPRLQLPGTPDSVRDHGSDSYAPPLQGQLMDGAWELLPHLQLPSTPDSGRGHGSDSDAPLPQGQLKDGAWELLSHLQLPGTPDSCRGHGSDSDAPPPQGQLMDIMSTNGCGRFAALVAATPNVGDIFLQHLVAGGGGLILFCPDDGAVDAFEPTFRALADGVRVSVLLQHGAAARYVRAELARFDLVAVPTLAVADDETVLVRDMGDSVRLWLGPTWPRDGQATVTRTISSDEHPLVLYVVDAVLLRQKLDGGDEVAAACGVLDLLRCCWPRICVGIGAVVLCRIITDVLVPRYRRQRPIRA
ncbi:hypothetical protein ACQ4PT_039175 [Festuca glaucescens]